MKIAYITGFLTILNIIIGIKGRSIEDKTLLKELIRELESAADSPSSQNQVNSFDASTPGLTDESQAVTSSSLIDQSENIVTLFLIDQTTPSTGDVAGETESNINESYIATEDKAEQEKYYNTQEVQEDSLGDDGEEETVDLNDNTIEEQDGEKEGEENGEKEGEEDGEEEGEEDKEEGDEEEGLELAKDPVIAESILSNLEISAIRLERLVNKLGNMLSLKTGKIEKVSTEPLQQEQEQLEMLSANFSEMKQELKKFRTEFMKYVSTMSNKNSIPNTKQAPIVEEAIDENLKLKEKPSKVAPMIKRLLNLLQRNAKAP